MHVWICFWVLTSFLKQYLWTQLPHPATALSEFYHFNWLLESQRTWRHWVKSLVSQDMGGKAILPREQFRKGMNTFVRNMASFVEVNQPLLGLRKYWPTWQDLKEMRPWTRDTAPLRKLTCLPFHSISFQAFSQLAKVCFWGIDKCSFLKAKEHVLCDWEQHKERFKSKLLENAGFLPPLA